MVPPGLWCRLGTGDCRETETTTKACIIRPGGCRGRLESCETCETKVQAILRFIDSADDHVLLSGGSSRFRVQQRTFPSIIACESDAIQDS